MATLEADERRVFLVGLSNGGTGVTRGAAASPAAYRGLVFISGILEDEVLLGDARPGGAASLPWPILVIHGRDDDRIPVAGVTRSVARLQARGATVDERIVDGEDHFLFFDRDAEVLAWVAAWMKDLDGARRREASRSRPSCHVVYAYTASHAKAQEPPPARPARRQARRDRLGPRSAALEVVRKRPSTSTAPRSSCRATRSSASSRPSTCATPSRI